MQVSPLCDKQKHADMAKSQNGFLEFVVKPLLKEIEEIEPMSHVKYESHWQTFGEGIVCEIICLIKCDLSLHHLSQKHAHPKPGVQYD